MFRWLIDRPITLYGFLSGMFMSVATTAMTGYALAADAPTNAARLIRCAAISFAAASSWFALGEYITILKERVRGHQEGVAGSKVEAYKEAVKVVEKDAAVWLYGLMAVGIACSVLWPFV